MQNDRETNTNEIFAILDKIDSDNEKDIDNLLEDSDNKYAAEEQVPETKEELLKILIPKANIHIERKSILCNGNALRNSSSQRNVSCKLTWCLIFNVHNNC